MRRFEVQFNRFLEVGKSLLPGLALAGNVEFEALGDIPLPLAPNASRKWSLHDLIVSQVRERCTAARVPMVASQIRSLTAPRNSVVLQRPSRRHPPGVWEGRSFLDGDFRRAWAAKSAGWASGFRQAVYKPSNLPRVIVATRWSHVLARLARYSMGEPKPSTSTPSRRSFDKRGGRGSLHPAPGRAIPEPLRVAVALRPQQENTISKAMSA